MKKLIRIMFCHMNNILLIILHIFVKLFKWNILHLLLVTENIGKLCMTFIKYLENTIKYRGEGLLICKKIFKPIMSLFTSVHWMSSQKLRRSSRRSWTATLVEGSDACSCRMAFCDHLWLVKWAFARSEKLHQCSMSCPNGQMDMTWTWHVFLWICGASKP